MNILEVAKQFYDKLNYVDKDDYIYVLCLVANRRYDDLPLYDKIFNKLIRDEWIIRKNGELVVNVVTEEDIDDFVEEYRELWHYKTTGVKGKMGSSKNVRERIIKFLNETGCSKQELLELAAYYTNNFATISGFLQQADYFLYKLKKIDGKNVTESRAAALLSEYKDFESTNVDFL